MHLGFGYDYSFNNLDYICMNAKLAKVTDEMIKKCIIEYFNQRVIFEDIQDVFVPYLEEHYGIDLNSYKETEQLEKYVKKWVSTNLK
jgi:hypothetical protein